MGTAPPAGDFAGDFSNGEGRTKTKRVYRKTGRAPPKGNAKPLFDFKRHEQVMACLSCLLAGFVPDPFPAGAGTVGTSLPSMWRFLRG